MHKFQDIQVCESSLDSVVGGWSFSPDLLRSNLQNEFKNKKEKAAAKLTIAAVLYVFDPAVELFRYYWSGTMNSEAMKKYDRGEKGIISFYFDALTDSHMDGAAVGTAFMAAWAIDDMCTTALTDTFKGADSGMEKVDFVHENTTYKVLVRKGVTRTIIHQDAAEDGGNPERILVTYPVTLPVATV